jgi:dTMP kinase
MLITFEGIDGCGKSTISREVYEELKKKGFDAVWSREPGVTAVGQKIREMVLLSSDSMDNMTEVLLFAANRAQHVAEIIAPCISEGKIVVLDRYVDSSIVYQGYARQVGMEDVYAINRYAIKGFLPDITVIIDTPPEIAMKRMKDKNPDRIEKEGLSFQKKLQKGFHMLVEFFPQRNFLFVDGSLPVSEIKNEVMEYIKKIAGL